MSMINILTAVEEIKNIIKDTDLDDATKIVIYDKLIAIGKTVYKQNEEIRKLLV